MYITAVPNIKMAKGRFILACIFGLLVPFASLDGQQVRVVRGRIVLDRDTTPVVGAQIAILGTLLHDLTDSAGRFELRGAPRGILRLAFEAPAIRSDTLALPFGVDTLTIYAAPRVYTLATVEVRDSVSARRADFEDVAQTSTVTIAAADIRATPGLLEADVLRTVQLLPGTVSRNDYTIGYNVRGGETDQNLILLDGMPVFNPSHLGGLFSTFDANAVGSADFLTGGFPAGYSGRLSSVLDLRLRDGNAEEFQFSGQVSLLASKFLAEGPVPGGGTVLAGARRTYADQVVAAFSQEELPYYFTDLISRARWPLPRGGEVVVSGYWGRDDLGLNLVAGSASRDRVDLAFNWGNRLLGARARVPAGRGWIAPRIGISDFTSTLGLLPDFARFDNSARLHVASLEWRPLPEARHDVRVGGSVERYEMFYDLSSPTLGTRFFSAHYQPTVWAAWLDDEWRAGHGLRLRPGVRLEHVAGAGFTGIAPRVAAKVFLTGDLAVTGSAGRYYQPIHSIRDQELPITIYEFWIGADGNVPVARSDHLVAGLERWVGQQWEFTFETYHKTFRNLITNKRADDPRVDGDEFVTLEGEASGFDLLVRRHVGRVRGWVAWSYTRAARRFEDGVAFAPAHDRRHTINLVLQAPGPLGSEMGVRWGYGSPLPYTPFIGEWDHRVYSATAHAFEDSNTEPIAGPINSARYPAYSRLDVGFRWSFAKFGGLWQPFLNLVNTYNRRNVFLYFFDYLDAPPTRTGVSQLPLLPTFGLEFNF